MAGVVVPKGRRARACQSAAPGRLHLYLCARPCRSRAVPTLTDGVARVACRPRAGDGRRRRAGERRTFSRVRLVKLGTFHAFAFAAGA